MKQTGRFNPEWSLERQGFRNLAGVHWNHPSALLYQAAVIRGEGHVAKNGPLVVETGFHTGRSPQDKFVVTHPEVMDKIWWQNNKPMTPDHFDILFEDMMAYAEGHELFAQDLHAGHDRELRLSIRVVTEYAWHSLFIQHLLIEPKRTELDSYVPEYLIVDLPGFTAAPDRHGCRSGTVIACDFVKKIVLIGGTSYAGEMKKSAFTIMNYTLPEKGVMPMHCSANEALEGGNPAVFFGLSGTGKTTLSAEPSRTLVGDDEHGWSPRGVFNFEGGCYAKMIHLTEEQEPQIYATTQRFGTVLENVVMDTETRELDFEDDSLTENTRGAYPLDYIPHASETGTCGHPKNVIMLTCDAFGIMPPVARLSPDQAMYHFLAGYTAKVAGTEKGVTTPEATFSTCFGAPFMPRHPSEYGNLLRKLIAEHGAHCWLLNTGWSGGPVGGEGNRMPLKVTRALLAAILEGSLEKAEMRRDPVFQMEVPVAVPGVDAAILDPRATWCNPSAYDAKAQELARLFQDQFKPFEDYVDEGVRAAAPRIV